MAYSKTTWVTGDVITAEKLNNIENKVEELDGASGDVEQVRTELTAQIEGVETELSGSIDALDERVAQAEAAVGAPMVASTVAGMTDHTKVYVYTGSETGYTSGNWYYWNGSAWTSGGVYNAVAVDTDKTLSVANKAADGKKVGDEISELKSDLDNYDRYYTIGFSANNSFTPCFIPKGTKVTVWTKDGNNFTGGTMYFCDSAKVSQQTMSLTSSLSTRSVVLNHDIYFVYLNSETTPTNITVSPAFAFENERKTIDNIASFYAMIADEGYVVYDKTSGKIHFNNKNLLIYINGTYVSINTATQKTQLGAAADDSSGILVITLGYTNVLVYDVSESSLKIVAENKFDYTKQIALFSSHYTNGNAGLLSTSSNSVLTRQSKAFIDDFNNKPRKVMKTPYAYLTYANTYKYDTITGKLNIGSSSIGIVNDGSITVFNHSTIISQLGASRAEEDASGNLIITVGTSNALIYDLSDNQLHIKAITSVDLYSQYVLFITYYGSGNTGLLAESNVSLQSRLREDITIERLINSAPAYTDDVSATALGNYEQNVADASVNSEFFLFFSDPHCMGDGNDSNLAAMIATIQKAYNSSSSEYVICGGDWLTNSDSFSNACYKLGYIKGIGKSILGGDNFYNLIGNHDTNYQGAQTLTESQLRNLWYGGGRCYYKIEKRNCTYFAFDTGLDNDDTLNAYRVEQLKWVCDELLTGSEAHYVMLLHIVFDDPNDTTSISAMSEELGNIITAYNGRLTYTIDGETFDFSQKTGRVCFTLCGHLHRDLNSTLGGVPLIAITNTAKNGNGTATFDLCVADFTNEVIKMTRIGYGEDRTFSFASA